MKRLLIMALSAMPVAALAQSQPTADDKLAAMQSMNAELMNVVTAQRAQINADIREREDLMKKLTELEKKTPPAIPTIPNNAPSKQ